jgi:hypothetical protein
VKTSLPPSASATPPPHDAARAFAAGFAATTGKPRALPSLRSRSGRGVPAELDSADLDRVGFTYGSGLQHAVRTYACVRARLARLLSAKCNVTVQFAAVFEHVDRNGSKRNGFLESLSSVYLTRIKHSRKHSTSPAVASSSDRLEGALYMPRAGIAVRRRPCWGIHVVYLHWEPHSVFAPPTPMLRLLRGVGGDSRFGIATIADWPRR